MRGVFASGEELWEIIKSEFIDNNIPANRVVIGGISLANPRTSYYFGVLLSRFLLAWLINWLVGWLLGRLLCHRRYFACAPVLIIPANWKHDGHTNLPMQVFRKAAQCQYTRDWPPKLRLQAIFFAWSMLFIKLRRYHRAGIMWCNWSRQIDKLAYAYVSQVWGFNS